MRASGVFTLLMLLLTATAAPAGAEDCVATGSATGTAVLRFSVNDVVADVSGTAEIAGSFFVGGRSIDFTASGSARGAARIGLASLDVAAWIVVDASGQTSEGESLTLRGGLTITEISGTGPAGSGLGRYDLALATPTLRLRAQGTAIGSAAGRFVVPKIEFTMQVDGNASFDLEGEVRDLSNTGTPSFLEEDPLDASTWPDDLAALLREALAETLVGEPI